MVCSQCRAQDHDHCADNPRKLAFSTGKLKGIPDGTAGQYCDCAHQEPIILTIPVKEVVE